MVLLVILISISLITKEAEHFFNCFSAIWIFSSEVCLLMFFAHFSVVLFVFFLFIFRGFLYVYGYPFFVNMCDTHHFSVDSLGFFRYIRIICK